jgi:D-3-phosphoglycerate dehydrogenase / 2-oxoglutarate reductase
MERESKHMTKSDEKMVALCTAEVSQEIEALENWMGIIYAGWVKDQRILSEDEMAALMEKHMPDILITSYDPITRRVIESSPNLKLVVCTRANPVNVDDACLREKNILFSYAPERNSDSTAEYTVAMMLSIMRRIPIAYHDLKSGLHTSDAKPEQLVREGLRRDVTWALGKDTPYVQYKGSQLNGKTLGIIGYGSIGRRVGKICRGFGMKIMVFDPHLENDRTDDAIFLDSLLELAEKSDVLTIHSKDTPDTFHLMNRKVFAHMKKDAFFINTSRGALVDEQALIEALKSRRIAGAALDVFESEPIVKDHPFLTECDNVIITPHLAGATYDAIDNHTIQLVKDVTHFLMGEPLEFEYKG